MNVLKKKSIYTTFMKVFVGGIRTKHECCGRERDKITFLWVWTGAGKIHPAQVSNLKYKCIMIKQWQYI